MEDGCNIIKKFISKRSLPPVLSHSTKILIDFFIILQPKILVYVITKSEVISNFDQSC